MNRTLIATLLALAGTLVHATPLVPSSDDEVVERLPAASGRATLVAPTDPRTAAARATGLVALARERGDPRPVGQALALLAPWRDDARADAAVVVALAEAEQFVHDFESARQRLQALVERQPSQAQAWLMLATLHRLQGRYAASDAACDGVAKAGAALHAAACRAENEALRGRFDASRAVLQRLLATARDGATQAWLSTTLAELEQRAGRPDAAEAGLRAALRLQPQDTYAALALADLCLAARRGDEARRVLAGRPDSDAVLLRIAAANPRDDVGRMAADTLRGRFAQADRRPGTAAAHARERAQLALHVEGDAATALRHALVNADVQREPLDLLLLAQSARAAGDAAALAQARGIVREMGLEDRRFDTVW